MHSTPHRTWKPIEDGNPTRNSLRSLQKPMPKLSPIALPASHSECRFLPKKANIESQYRPHNLDMDIDCEHRLVDTVSETSNDNLCIPQMGRTISFDSEVFAYLNAMRQKTDAGQFCRSLAEQSHSPQIAFRTTLSGSGPREIALLGLKISRQLGLLRFQNCLSSNSVFAIQALAMPTGVSTASVHFFGR